MKRGKSFKINIRVSKGKPKIIHKIAKNILGKNDKVRDYLQFMMIAKNVNRYENGRMINEKLANIKKKIIPRGK